jgi:20S proteasome alpha/beta subunit
MTLALALRGSNGLVLGTDSRVTSVQLQPNGQPQQVTRDTSEKFLQVNRDIGVLTYGLAEPGYSGISRLVEQAKRERYPSYKEIETAAQGIFQAEFTAWTQAQPQPGAAATGVVGFILAGYDSVLTNQFKVTSFQSSSTFQPQEIINPTFLAAQFHIAQYLSGKLARPEMTVDQLTQLAVFLMLETMSTEITVGGPIQLATVTIRNGFRRVSEEEIDKLLEICQAKTRAFRRLLLELYTEGLST